MTAIKRIRRAVPASSHRILGIDASLTSTGYAYRNSNDLYAGTVAPGKLKGPYRLAYIRDRIREVVAFARPTLVVMEDYAMGRSAKISMPFHIGELGGVIKTLLWDLGHDVMLVPPTSLKMIVAGHGFAKKPDMRVALELTFGHIITQDDEADAAGLMLVGELASGVPVVSPEVYRELRLDTLTTFPVVPGKLQSIANRIQKA